MRKIFFSKRNPKNMNNKYATSLTDLRGDKITVSNFYRGEYEDNSMYA